MEVLPIEVHHFKLVDYQISERLTWDIILLISLNPTIPYGLGEVMLMVNLETIVQPRELHLFKFLDYRVY